MEKRACFSCITLITLSAVFFIRCSDDSVITEDVSDLSEISLRSSYDNYFNYEDSAQIKMTNESGLGVMKRLPWQYGIPNAGIPESWCDPNIESSDKSIKKYTKDKGWELVYSNVREATAFKYIALYNKYTGIMRFFMCIFAEPGGSGSSSSMWGVYINNSTSLLNFTYKYAKGINDKAASPSFITTPVGNFSNNVFSGVGLQNGVWYGMEIECAYDPSISSNSAHTLTLMGRAVDETITVPGSGSSSNAIYNKTLGVWNLQETPSVDVNVQTETGDSPKVKLYRYLYSMEEVTISLNPEVSTLFNLENSHQELILKEGSTIPLNGSLVPCAYQDSTKYYTVSGYLESASAYPRASQLQGFTPDFLVKVSFDLVHKTTNEKYSFSRYFAVNKRYNP